MDLGIIAVRRTGKVGSFNKPGVETFDPQNKRHREIFRKYMASGKMDTTLRFSLEGFDTLPGMMMYKMAIFGAGALDKIDKLVEMRRNRHLSVVKK